MTVATPSAAPISVIVPTFNRASYIEQCLDSLLAQTVPALEILVVDDGSQDDTAQRVARYGSRVTYIHKPNGGKPSAVNLGLQRARGREKGAPSSTSSSSSSSSGNARGPAGPGQAVPGSGAWGAAAGWGSSAQRWGHGRGGRPP
jgi:hypothetical protein